MSQRLARELLEKLNSCFTVIRAGGKYAADGPNWAMSEHAVNGQRTGNAVLVCMDKAALREFTRLAGQAGYLVEAVGPTAPNAVIISLK